MTNCLLSITRLSDSLHQPTDLSSSRVGNLKRRTWNFLASADAVIHRNANSGHVHWRTRIRSKLMISNFEHDSIIRHIY